MRKLLGVCLLLWSAAGWSQDNDLEEAQGLPDEKPKAETKSGWAWPQGLSERSYLWLEGHSRKAARGDWDKVLGPDAEASTTLNYKAGGSTQLFLDGRVLRETDFERNRGVLEQAGVRYQATDNVLVALGKERSRKAPGLIVAPSDFLYTQENLPGQREQRAGIWQGRAAWQESGRSLEVMVLPYDTVQDNGMPDSEARWNGWATRGFYQFSNFDLQLSAGHLRDGWHEGLSSQGILGAWKVYAEAGWQEHGKSQLGGIEYQGWDKWSVRAEYYHQDPAASRADLERIWQLVQRLGSVPGGTSFRPFVRASYGIASVSALGLVDRWNLFATLIRAVDDRGFIGNARAEWLIDDHQQLGLSGLGFSEGDHQQYALRPFDRQLSLDWKFTF